MSGEILIARAAARPAAPAPPTALQRLLRRGLVGRLAGLQAGAIWLHDALGDLRLGDPRGPLGTIDLWVRDPAFWQQVAFGGDVGAGEAYVQGLWSTSDLVRLLRLFVRDRRVLLEVDRSAWSLPRRLLLRLGQWLRANSRRGSARNIEAHYDLGDELFAKFLDPTMTYSSAWFEHDGQSLEDAQRNKLRRLCRLVDLASGDRLAEIGTGWGSLALCAASEFGAIVTTTTISPRQAAYARRQVAAADLGDRIEVQQRDYRDFAGTFDKLISCEMIEAVGARYLPAYLRACSDLLRPGGLFGLQAITIADQHYAAALAQADYIQRHVFPGSFIPSVTAIIGAATAGTTLRLERLEQFGGHYARTLACWREALLRDPQPFHQRGGEAMVRAWEYYFAYCESGFREGHISVSHLRFRKAGGAPAG